MKRFFPCFQCYRQDFHINVEGGDPRHSFSHNGTGSQDALWMLEKGGQPFAEWLSVWIMTAPDQMLMHVKADVLNFDKQPP